ncbi:tetraacyldisaccharide 4'-kinase, partial [Persicitalea sp.]|uniref:tetraacyldisaccharide 4'-kinase n=1 Tax=Persicitalea sp. TaxID=3100273 RepID=UPI00359377FE
MKNIGRNTQQISKRQTTQFILKPFSWLYGLATMVRNVLYDTQLFELESSPQFSVVVGNLTVGGTGKTPMIEYLIRYLQQESRIVTLSRGYGR